MSRRTLFAALALAVVLPACPGSLDDPGRFSSQFGGGGVGGGACTDIPALFQTSCAVAGCHTEKSPSAMLDLASEGIYMRLSGKKPIGGAGLLIDPSHPEASVLYTKLTSTPPFGSRMPLTGAALDDTTVSCVLDWLTKGGPQ